MYNISKKIFTIFETYDHSIFTLFVCFCLSACFFDHLSRSAGVLLVSNVAPSQHHYCCITFVLLLQHHYCWLYHSWLAHRAAHSFRIKLLLDPNYKDNIVRIVETNVNELQDVQKTQLQVLGPIPFLYFFAPFPRTPRTSENVRDQSHYF